MASKLIPLSANTLLSRLANKNIVIIGGTAGIGKCLAVACLKRGAKVTVVGRRQPDSELEKATFIRRDLSSMKDAYSLVEELPLESLDILVFTNGIFASPSREETSEGVERDLAVSYLSRFAILRRILTDGKLAELGSKRADTTVKPKIFIMGYPGKKNKATLDDFNSKNQYTAMTAHMNTVVANEAIISYFDNKAAGKWNLYGLNPGIIKTEIRDNFLGKGSFLSWFMEGIIGFLTVSATTYAENVLVHLVATDQYENASTTIFNQKGKILQPNPYFKESGIRDRVIQESDKVLSKAYPLSTEVDLF